MKKIGVHPNARSYNIIIKAWTRKSRGRLGAEMAEAVLNSMISDGNVKPNEISFTTVLNAWAKVSANDEVLFTFKHFRSNCICSQEKVL